jgi:hypothetical protein
MSNSNSNSNCLTGFRCPECGSDGPFKIEAVAISRSRQTGSFTVWDNGTEDYADVQWHDDSYCQCVMCGDSGKVRNFQSTEDEEEEDETAA